MMALWDKMIMMILAVAKKQIPVRSGYSNLQHVAKRIENGTIVPVI